MTATLAPAFWPEFAYDAWKDTYATLHLWTQIVGKMRVAQTPWLNHSWHVTFEVSVRGLITPPIPCGATGDLQVEFDFIEHVLWLRSSAGAVENLQLRPISVAQFHAELVSTLAAMGFCVTIHPAPNEIADAIPFAEDYTHAAYDAAAVQRLG